MDFDSYIIIEKKISETYDVIHDGWYTNYIHTINAYNISIHHL